MIDPRRVPSQASRYLRGFFWLVRESVRVAGAEWRRVVLATVVFLAGNAALLGAIFLYVRLLESNQAIELLLVTLHPRESTILLGAFIGTVLLGLSTIALSQYVARTAALRIHRRYQEEITRTTLRLLERVPDACAPEVAVLTRETGLRPYYMEYPRSCGWTMRFIANAFPALALFGVAFSLLLWLDPWITLLVVLFGLLLVAAQYPPSIVAAHASKVVDQTRVDFTRRLQSLAAHIDQSPPVTAADGALAGDIERFYHAPLAMRYQDAQQNRYWALELSALMMQTGGAIALTFILFTIVHGLLVEGGDWATLAVYAALLRQLLGTATDVFRAITVFSRFSPHITAVRLFVAQTRHPRTCVPPPLPERLPLYALNIDGDDETTYLLRGERFYIVTRGGSGRSLALDLQSILMPASAGEQATPPSLPAIEFLAVNHEPRANPAANADELCRLLEETRGIVLADVQNFAQLDAEPQERVKRCTRSAALGLVKDRPPERVADGTLMLIRDVQGRWYWLRAGEQGLLAVDRRKILQRLRHPSSAGKGDQVALDVELE